MQNNGISGYLKPKGSGDDQSMKRINDEKQETVSFNIPSQSMVDELGYLVLTGDESRKKRSSVSSLTNNDVDYFKHHVIGHGETTSLSSSPSIPAENYPMQIHHTYFGLGDSLEVDPKDSQVEDDSFREESHVTLYVTLEEDRGTEAIQHTYAGLKDFSKEDENGDPPSRIREGQTSGAPGHAHRRCGDDDDDDDDDGNIDTNVNDDEQYWEVGHDDHTSSTMKQANDSDRSTKPLYCTGESLVDKFGYLVLTDD